MSLATLGLCNELLRATKEKSYTQATEIQKSLIPAILTGRDILAGAQTGSGKTAGYALPILNELNKADGTYIRSPKALIIVPTRELAKQIYTSFQSYSAYTTLKTSVIHGGANIKAQANRLSSGTDIVVSTSGRLIEHIKRKNISLENIRYLVLDEADTILDMGFIKEIATIIEYLPSKRQNILISATLTPALKKLSQQLLRKPKLIESDHMGSSASSVTQVVYPVVTDKKLELLSYLIGSKNYSQVMVFVRKKDLADLVSRELNASGLKCEAIHGDKSSGVRDRSLEKFKNSKIRVLVATDIAARGIDIPSLKIVINYDIPHVISDYIHRIGRTGRAGKKGLAITLSTLEESIALKDLERLLGKAIPKELLPEYAPTKIENGQKKSKLKEKKEKTAGAFGRKKSTPKKVSKKRKTTKRDGWKR